MGKTFEEIIRDYLTEFANKDECFAAKFYSPKKTVAQCCQYIISEAQKQANGKSEFVMADEDVYYLARHYYEEENIEVGIDNGQTVVRTGNVKDITIKQKEKKPKIEKRNDQLDLFDFSYED